MKWRAKLALILSVFFTIFPPARALKAAFSLAPDAPAATVFSESFDNGATQWGIMSSGATSWEEMAGEGVLRLRGPADFSGRVTADAVSPQFMLDGPVEGLCRVRFSHDFDDAGSLEIAFVDISGHAVAVWSSLECENHDGLQWIDAGFSFVPPAPGRFRLRLRYGSGTLAPPDGRGWQASFVVDDIWIGGSGARPDEGAEIEAGGSVRFYNHTDGQATLKWEFPGARPEISNEENPVVVYDRPGDYDVALTAMAGAVSDKVVAKGFVKVRERGTPFAIKPPSALRSAGSGLPVLPPGVPLRFTVDAPGNVSHVRWSTAGGRGYEDLICTDAECSALVQFGGTGQRTVVAVGKSAGEEYRAELKVDVVSGAAVSNISPGEQVELLPVGEVGNPTSELFPAPAAPCAVDNVSIMLADVEAGAGARAEVRIYSVSEGTAPVLLGSASRSLDGYRSPDDYGMPVPLAVEFATPAVIRSHPFSVRLLLEGVRSANIAGVKRTLGQSLAFTPSCSFSVLGVTEPSGASSVEFPPAGGERRVRFHSLLDCQYQLDCDWVHATYLDEAPYGTLILEASPLPLGCPARQGRLTVTDGISAIDISFEQKDTDRVEEIDAPCPVIVAGREISLSTPGAFYMDVVRADGTVAARRVTRFRAGEPGVFILRISRYDGSSRFLRIIL